MKTLVEKIEEHSLVERSLNEGFFKNTGTTGYPLQIQAAFENISKNLRKYRKQPFRAIRDNEILRHMEKNIQVKVTSTYGSGEQIVATIRPKYTSDSWSAVDSWFIFSYITETGAFSRNMTWDDLIRKLYELSAGELEFDVTLV